MKRLIFSLVAAALVSSLAAPALAQYQPFRPRAEGRLDGTIVYVRGHLVTLQQSDRRVIIDDQPALDRERTGRVAVGRSVIAYGYWNGGVFYATALE
jgi:hypothetical protein